MESAPILATLYVGDLDAEVKDVQLHDLFIQAGHNIASLHVCRHPISRRCVGYAYINFNSLADAARALESINYTTVNGKAIRIMWCDRDRSKRQCGLGNIFVKSLHKSIDNKELHDIFSPVGNILSCKVSIQEGKSRGYGFVQFETNEAANSAIDKFNGTIIKGQKIYVEKFIKKSERTLRGAEIKFTNVYVKNIDLDITEDILRDQFAIHGNITNAIIMKDEDLKSKGFGFINFESSDDAKKAVNAMNGALLGSKTIFVAQAQKKAERERILRRQFEEKRLERIQKYQGSNLYMKNLVDQIDDEFLRRRFSSYGNIVSAKVMRDEKGFSKGFGFVCFSSPEEATRALAEHGSILFGKPIYVTIAQRREVRRAQLEQKFASRMPGPPSLHGSIMPAPYGPTCFTAPPGMGSAFPQTQGMAAYPIGVPPPPLNPADGSSTLASAPPQEQKQILGEHLFPLVRKLQFNLARKITGMLLDLDNAELLILLESPPALTAKVEEAVRVLQQHMKAGHGAQDPSGSNANQQDPPPRSVATEQY